MYRDIQISGAIHTKITRGILVALFFPEQSYEPFDGSTLHEQKCAKVQEYMPDDGDGKVEVKNVKIKSACDFHIFSWT